MSHGKSHLISATSASVAAVAAAGVAEECGMPQTNSDAQHSLRCTLKLINHCGKNKSQDLLIAKAQKG